MKHAIAKYMSDECGCPISVYTDDVIFGIVKHAFFDYLEHAERFRCVAAVRRLFESCVAERDDCIKILISLGLTQVAERDEKGDYRFIDGFHNTKFTETALDHIYNHDHEENNYEEKGENMLS